MPVLRYTPKALQDLRDIAGYTLSHWGEVQVTRYMDDLEDACLLLAQHPLGGRALASPGTPFRRFEQASHIILYRPISGGIRVQRIIHKRRLVHAHLH